jgi:hypothetical protein
MVNGIIQFFTSLKLTVVCLGFAIILVFIGTMAQVDLGIHIAQQKYFQSFFIYWSPENSTWRVPVFPGGRLIGGFLFINLIAAHIYRFQMRWNKLGILLLHLGIFLLLLGGLLTELLSVESQMRIREGETKNYSESLNSTELIIVDASQQDLDEVVSIPDGYLGRHKMIQHPRLPFRVNVVKFFSNSTVVPSKGTPSAVTHGFGKDLIITEMPRVTKQNEMDIPSVIFEIVSTEGSLGTWLCSLELMGRQEFQYQGKRYELQLRQERYYKPYSIKLLDFTHDRYDGTDIPKNFSSKIRLVNAEKKDDREVLIYMNNPLRYEGETYYQSGFERDNLTTVLQVVRNPGWITPYLACALVALGLVIQFSMHLFKFGRRKDA